MEIPAMKTTSLVNSTFQLIFHQTDACEISTSWISFALIAYFLLFLRACLQPPLCMYERRKISRRTWRTSCAGKCIFFYIFATIITRLFYILTTPVSSYAIANTRRNQKSKSFARNIGVPLFLYLFAQKRTHIRIRRSIWNIRLQEESGNVSRAIIGY